MRYRSNTFPIAKSQKLIYNNSVDNEQKAIEYWATASKQDDDYKLSFYKKANKRFTSKYVNKTKKVLKWLNNQL